MRQQHEADDDAAYDVAHDDLKEREVRVVGEARDADDGQRAGLGGDDGERDRPPRDVAVGKKVIPQRALLLAEAQPEQRDADQVERDDG